MNIKSLLIVGLTALTCCAHIAYAQSGETTFNYSLVVYNPAKSLAGERILNGVGGSLGFNFGDYFTAKGEIQGYLTTTFTYHVPPGKYTSGGTFQSGASMVSYLFGPQFNLPLNQKQLFGEALFGFANTGAYSNLFQAAGVKGITANNSGFAMAFGGGFDFHLAKHVAVRPAQIDYFMTRYEWRAIGINNQSNFRFQAGLVFAWGDEGN